MGILVAITDDRELYLVRMFAGKFVLRVSERNPLFPQTKGNRSKALAFAMNLETDRQRIQLGFQLLTVLDLHVHQPVVRTERITSDQR